MHRESLCEMEQSKSVAPLWSTHILLWVSASPPVIHRSTQLKTPLSSRVWTLWTVAMLMWLLVCLHKACCTGCPCPCSLPAQLCSFKLHHGVEGTGWDWALLHWFRSPGCRWCCQAPSQSQRRSRRPSGNSEEQKFQISSCSFLKV